VEQKVFPTSAQALPLHEGGGFPGGGRQVKQGFVAISTQLMFCEPQNVSPPTRHEPGVHCTVTMLNEEADECRDEDERDDDRDDDEEERLDDELEEDREEELTEEDERDDDDFGVQAATHAS
jgi:hypothetical protein